MFDGPFHDGDESKWPNPENSMAPNRAAARNPGCWAELQFIHLLRDIGQQSRTPAVAHRAQRADRLGEMLARFIPLLRNHLSRQFREILGYHDG